MNIYIYKVNIEIYTVDRIWNQCTVNVEALDALDAENLALYYVKQCIDTMENRQTAKSHFRVTEFFALPEVQDIDVDLYVVKRIQHMPEHDTNI
jgi:hypothetical protein